MISKPRCFNDLLELQRILDKEIEKNRSNGFIPRKRTYTDMKFSLQDELMELLKEFPYELNFKTWKQKVYSREKELEECVDCLFFFLQIINLIIVEIENSEEFKDQDNYIKYLRGLELTSEFDYKKLLKKNLTEIKYELEEQVEWFIKYLFYFDNIEDTYNTWLNIVSIRGFSEQEILETYWKKWQTNMKRINEDWVIHE